MATSSDSGLQASWLFSGNAVSRLDQKFRITVPADWRADGRLTEVFLVHNPGRNCITALPRDVFMQVKAEAQEAIKDPARRRKFLSQFYSGAVQAGVDSQGRMVLAEELRTAYRIDKEVALSGSIDRFELRSPEAWEECKRIETPDYVGGTEDIGL